MLRIPQCGHWKLPANNARIDTLANGLTCVTGFPAGTPLTPDVQRRDRGGTPTPFRGCLGFGVGLNEFLAQHALKSHRALLGSRWVWLQCK